MCSFSKMFDQDYIDRFNAYVKLEYNTWEFGLDETDPESILLYKLTSNGKKQRVAKFSRCTHYENNRLPTMDYGFPHESEGFFYWVRNSPYTCGCFCCMH